MNRSLAGNVEVLSHRRCSSLGGGDELASHQTFLQIPEISYKLLWSEGGIGGVRAKREEKLLQVGVVTHSQHKKQINLLVLRTSGVI